MRDHAVVFCSRIEHSNACCNVSLEHDDDICISFICIIYAIYYTKKNCAEVLSFSIRKIPYILYVFSTGQEFFRVAWPCEDFRENAACAAFALQESFLNEIPCSTFCASRPPRISSFFRYRIRIHLELPQRERERENSRTSTKTVRNFVSLCLPSFRSLLLLVLLLHIIIAQYYY